MWRIKIINGHFVAHTRPLHCSEAVGNRCKRQLLKQTPSTHESVDAKQDEVDGDDDGALYVDDGTSYWVVVDEQVGEQPLLVRRVPEQIPRYNQTSQTHTSVQHSVKSFLTAIAY